MSNKTFQGSQELLCINTEKVYDWILEEATSSQTIPVSRLGIPAAILAVICNPAAHTTINCILTDSMGRALPLNSEITVTELGPRIDRQFEVDGALVTLQRVSFTKTVFIVLEFSGVTPATGVPFIFTTEPIPFTITETAFLCAPPGTTLVVRLTDFECQTVLNCAAGALVSVGVTLLTCQSIQTVTPVTLELTADFCAPRETLIESCPTPLIPPQCPVIFPGITGGA